jgi:hypothetical protein
MPNLVHIVKYINTQYDSHAGHHRVNSITVQNKLNIELIVGSLHEGSPKLKVTSLI